jgi:hypothetical protein
MASGRSLVAKEGQAQIRNEDHAEIGRVEKKLLRGGFGPWSVVREVRGPWSAAACLLALAALMTAILPASPARAKMCI